jgi:tetratricopeptide (TPR) repeat protein
VDLCRRLLGDKHASTSLWLLELGKALRHQGKHEEAEQVLREARQIQLEYSARQTHKNVELAEINQWLAHVLNDTRRCEEAEKLVNEALAIKRDALGDDHLDVAGLLCTLASIRERKGDRSSAEQLVWQAVDMGRRLDDVGMQTGAHLHQLGALLYRQDKLAEADVVLRESLQLQRSVLGGDHPAVAECSITLAKLAARQGRFQEGEELARDALRIYEARPDGAAWLHADTESTLGAALAGQSRFTEAETLLAESFDVLREQSIAPPWVKADSLMALTALYEQWDAAEPGKGYAEKAAVWRTKLEETPKSPNVETSKDNDPENTN